MRVEALGPDTLVVRGGVSRDPEALMERIEDAIEDGYGPVLSVNCGQPHDGESFTETLHRICTIGRLPHGSVQFTRYDRLDELDVPLTSDTSEGQAENHYHAWFRSPVEKSQVEDFIACFEGPIENPTGGKKRSQR